MLTARGLLLCLLSASLPAAGRGFVPSSLSGGRSVPTPTAGGGSTPPLRSVADGELAAAAEDPAAAIIGLVKPVKPETAAESPVATASSDALRLDDGQHRRTSLPGDVSPGALLNWLVLLAAVTLVAGRFLSVDLGLTRGWTPLEVAERVPLDNWRGYNDVLTAAPVQTKAATSATVYTIGDIIAQTKGGSDMGELDRSRIVRSMVAGLVGHGPMSHLWYRWSEAFFDAVHLPHAWWDFVPKVCADQLVFGPVWNGTFILLLGIMQLHGPGRIWDEMRRTTVPLLLSGLRLWPFVHIVTYGVIPVEKRLIWVDAVEIVWVTILASVANEGGEEEEVGQSLDREDDNDVR